MYFKLPSILFTQIVMWGLLFFMLFPQQWLWVDIVRIIFSILFLLYLPWYWIWYIFFHSDSISAFERFIINFLISATLVILIAYYLYFSGTNISSILIYLVTFIILFVSIAIVLIRRRDIWIDEDIDLTDSNHSK